MASTAFRCVVTAVSAVALVIVPVAPVAGAEQPCADPAMCQAPLPPTPVHEDVELHSSPDPYVMPQVPQSSMPPWQAINAPGEARNRP
ncbi:hypothetical protein [Mycobacteroides franklinii]|uniref:Uncharacterized protein n=1 Tax=Mycobacteroides franklinii TaxID=948102 RepID=A0A4R8R6S2_9MYCO|nr:hypothetical protein [Mycobacteroides franklinii]TDZ41773.1 hypothetical protein CCUG64054_01806 [Mycobacteroides franklinii]TDZ51921.1 hypothetical protein CCUG63697_00391 [Mycobacteroides franklinii]TDZ55328.1 hypothetical protein CCUG63696_01809 [Mycobacteroides franklinii]TDZ62269.1 hypothetical protein CCUG63695_01733 [Mycobacteroides franklinii]TDZ68666.1 hypothetical protein CCUG64056_01806 [Mycobacteroides franklinii]